MYALIGKGLFNSINDQNISPLKKGKKRISTAQKMYLHFNIHRVHPLHEHDVIITI